MLYYAKEMMTAKLPYTKAKSIWSNELYAVVDQLCYKFIETYYSL